MKKSKVLKNQFVQAEKSKLIGELMKYPDGKIYPLLFKLTGRETLSTANLFCLALMVNIVRKAPE